MRKRIAVLNVQDVSEHFLIAWVYVFCVKEPTVLWDSHLVAEEMWRTLLQKKEMSKMPEKEKKQLDVHAIVRAMYDLFVWKSWSARILG